MKLAVAVTLLLSLVCQLSASTDDPPGSIRLLPGYVHKHGWGIDSSVGTIAKKGGLEIHYDIGAMAGNYADCGKLCGWTDNEVWRKKQVVDDQEVICVFTRKKMMVISFPKATANFYATIHSEEDIADMLFMVLTFRNSGK